MTGRTMRLRHHRLIAAWLCAATLGLALVAPAFAEDRIPEAGSKLGGAIHRPVAPGVRVVTQPVVVAGPPRTVSTADQPLICTSIYGNAICRCSKKCVATRSDCRCED